MSPVPPCCEKSIAGRVIATTASLPIPLRQQHLVPLASTHFWGAVETKCQLSACNLNASVGFPDNFVVGAGAMGKCDKFDLDVFLAKLSYALP
jgi:hypothetical protein